MRGAGAAACDAQRGCGDMLRRWLEGATARSSVGKAALAPPAPHWSATLLDFPAGADGGYPPHRRGPPFCAASRKAGAHDALAPAPRPLEE